MPSLPATARPSGNRASGFTLVELMVTLVVFAVVVGAVTLVMFNMSRSKQQTAMQLEGEAAARAALDMITRDVRSAGYGIDNTSGTPQTAIAYVDSMELIITTNQQPWPDTAAARRGVPQAVNPAGTPLPRPLMATSWTPTMKYGSGAEMIRYTLDVDNDGTVGANDLASVQGGDARATRNPNDYVLVRQVYGDSTGNVAGDNGGAQERVALVLKPGGDVPPLYRVYMRGSTTPWNWASGPVPAAQLADIERVEVTVTASSARPNARGDYARVSLQSDVSSMRNVPDFGARTYLVSGYVFDDRNNDGTMNGMDVGLANVQVRLGSYVGYTAASGYFAIRAPNGTYTLRHTPPAGFGVRTSPDSFVVTIASAPVTRSFADTARAGGTVSMFVYEDQDGNGAMNGAEGPLPGIQVTMSPGGETQATSASGTAALFAQEGGYSVQVLVPDSMTATTTNPVSGTMTNGGSASYSVGLKRSANGKLRGYVYRDNNRNMVRDSGEPGIQNAWVGVTTDAGVSVQGYAYTDASGLYEITVPVNDPPRTQPYSVFVVPPGGLYPTSSTSLGPRWVTSGSTVTGGDFGMAGYQIITLNASRVLSLAAGNLIEKDWNGNQTQNARGDADLVLGADAGGTDNVSVWFNAYNAASSFSASPTYTRNAPQSVLAMSLDTLDRVGDVKRPDLVSGTRKAANGNFFVWFNQGSSGNEGYFPTSFSAGQNYTTLDNGDVQAVVTIDCAGGASPDIIVGTKSAFASEGSLEIWQSNDAATPTFSRVETISTLGASSVKLGEVNSMVLRDLDNDGRRDLIVCTKTSAVAGQIVIYRNVSKTAGNRFVYQNSISVSGEVPKVLACPDVSLDGYADIVLGTQSSGSSGRLWYFRSFMPTVPWLFAAVNVVDAPGIVLSLHAADMGGNPSVQDLIVGWRATDTGYAGGVLIFFLDLGGLPGAGVDPSSGSIVNMVPAVTAANLNYGVQPSTPSPPLLDDLAAGVKTGLTTGALVLFIR